MKCFVTKKYLKTNGLKYSIIKVKGNIYLITLPKKSFSNFYFFFKQKSTEMFSTGFT